MRASVLILQDAPWPELRERAQQAETCGFDTIWVADHVVEPYRPQMPWSEAWTLLGALAVSIQRASLGALTSSMTLRNPAMLVQSVRTLDSISSGRAELALGAGGAPIDHTATGVAAWSPAERAGRFAEFVPAVAGLLRGDSDPSESTIPPVPGVRLTVAGLGPRSIGLAARFGDAWNSYGVMAGRRLTEGRLSFEDTLDLFRKRAATARRACEAARRDFSSLEKSYTWVESHADPELTQRDRYAPFARAYHAAGITELVVYWPADPKRAEAMAGVARMLHEL